MSKRSRWPLALGALVIVGAGGIAMWKLVLNEKPVEKKTVNAADLPSPVETLPPDAGEMTR